eukprot:SM000027S09622  [mRNA]  locus=s27:370437:373349:- [translate_table: standard]
MLGRPPKERSAQLAAVAMIDNTEVVVTVATKKHSTMQAAVLLDTGAQPILVTYCFAEQLQCCKDDIYKWQ